MTTTPRAILESWSTDRVEQFLVARGVSEDEIIGLSSSKHALTDLALSRASDPIIVRKSVTSAIFNTWTHDQLIHWVAVYQNKRISSRGANVFDSPPARLPTEAKKPWFLNYAKKLFAETVRTGDVEAQRKFEFQVAEVESRPHVFEGYNAILDREAKYNRHDLRILLNVFGIGISQDATREYCLQAAKESTAFFSKGTNSYYNGGFAKDANSFGAGPFTAFYKPSRNITFS